MAFINPYNFVRQGADLLEEHYKEYARLDRYEGRSGRMEFTLQNLSPLFIADPEGTTYRLKPGSSLNKPDYHKVADFFNVNGMLAIPGTSLKGMIRSVAEALSNSSFGVFTPDEKLFTFRKVTNLRSRKDLVNRKWGRWAKNNTIIPLETAKIWREAFDAALGIPNGDAGDQQRNVIYTDLRNNPITIAATLWQLHTGPCHVQRFQGAYKDIQFDHEVFSANMSRFSEGILTNRKKEAFKSEVIDNASQAIFKGPMMQRLKKALKLSNENGWLVRYQTVSGIKNGRTGRVENRVSVVEYKSGRWTASRRGFNAVPWPRADWADMDRAARDNSHYIAALIEDLGAKPLSVSSEALKSYGAAYGGEPGPGDIVRYFEENREVAEFGPVGMYKTPENNTVGELAATTPPILPRKKNTSLCPASRLFGWTPEKEKKQQNEEEMPVAGRVRIGVAWSDKRTADTRPATLKILGSPKPKYYPFYLRPFDQAQSPEYRGAGYYSTNASPGDWWPMKGALRGRKFYLHHPCAILDPNRQGQARNRPRTPDEACDLVKMTPEMVQEGEGLQSHQNMTACVLPPGGTFTGYLEFDSLSDYELGLLLWAVSLSDSPLQGHAGRAHKLGMGRPIGMGTVRLAIGCVSIEDPVGGWTAAEHQGAAKLMDAAEAERLVRVFKSWMITGREKDNQAYVKEFDQQVYFQELCEILSLDLAGEAAIQYHPGITLEYFAKQRKVRNDGREETLKSPIAIRNGRVQS